MPSNIVRDLQLAAARVAAATCPGCAIGHVVITNPRGEVVFRILIPPLVVAEEEAERRAAKPDEPPILTPGWSFAEGVAIYDGRVVQTVSPGRVKLLKALAEARGALTARQLTEQVYDAETDIQNTRFHIRQLNRELSEDPRFADFEGELIAGDKDGYRLVLK